MHKKLHIAAAGVLGLLITVAAAQSTDPATPKFEVASIKPNKSADQPYSNFPLGPGDVYIRNGGYLSATGFPLITYLSFAYKIIGNQGQYLAPQLPEWAKTERFDIQARAQSDPGKDGMRLMMRALLAERFKLVLHYEEREVPVFAFVLAKSGKLGPDLHSHPTDSMCPTEPPTVSTPAVINGKPVFCNGIYPLSASLPGRFRFGGRNVTIGFIADTFSAGTNLGRPMTDQTGLSGKFDFSLEWVQERREPAPPGADTSVDAAGPTFEQALRDQLGIKLQPQKGTIRVLVIDHVERPSAN
jgi:uncharacterized protein (TIGR03435 family)